MEPYNDCFFFIKGEKNDIEMNERKNRIKSKLSLQFLLKLENVDFLSNHFFLVITFSHSVLDIIVYKIVHREFEIKIEQ